MHTTFTFKTGSSHTPIDVSAVYLYFYRERKCSFLPDNYSRNKDMQ